MKKIKQIQPIKADIEPLIKEAIKHYYSLGLEDDQICDLLDVGNNVLETWLKENRELRNAKKVGLNVTNVKVLEALLKSALGHTNTTRVTNRRFSEEDMMTVIGKTDVVTKAEISPSLAAIKMWLNVRAKNVWKDTAEAIERNNNIEICINGKDITFNTKTTKDED